ncbi:MAG: DNA polymerase III subunit gamma/tau, partial [Clostridiales bacterium]|nr:DNA polymerase III subunit gamma/tau [Clostridiales bacterium]
MYQVLYRKYRPKVFSDVYGQDHVTSTLINEIKENHISHAYLFTGSRGTGKTSCAKILAKAVNCEHNVNGEPCNECEICRGLDAGTIYDVVEIDAASNNGVDNIRDLREKANYMPARGKYRVYIIDEVHMLSTGAFNALLKTLEEPPAHVIFILATTEVHKLPATILSRCQRFDFKRIRPETMAIRLKEVAGFENIKLSDEAAILISRIADGAMRDALSILDQCAGRSKDVDEKLVSEVAGIAGKESLYRLSEAASGKNSAEALNIISDLYQNSFDMERLCVEMINHFRNFLIVKTVNKSRELIICTDDEYESIKSGAADYTLPGIIYALDLFQNSLAQIKAGANSRIEMEMSFIKLCEPKLETSVDSLLSRMSELENAVKNGAAVKNTFDSSKNNSNQNSYKMKSESEEKNEAQAPAAEKFSEESKIEDESKSEETESKQSLAESRASTGEAPSNPEKAVQEPFRQWADFMEEI